MSPPIVRSELHLFNTSENGYKMAFQINTGIFFVLTPLCESILSKCQGHSVETVADELDQEYDRREVLDAIDALLKAGLIDLGFSGEHQATSANDEKASEIAETSSITTPDLFHITLHISHACNIVCAYCFAHGGAYGSPPRLMRKDVAQQAVRWALEAAKPFERCHIGFFGGEPLLNFRLIRDIVPFAREYADRLGIQVSFGIATNGTVLSSEILQFLMVENIQIQVSVDGNATDQNRFRKFSEGTDTYDVVAENLEKLTDRLPDSVSVHATMTSYNLDRESIANDLGQLGACSVEVAPVVAAPQEPFALREEHLPALKKKLFELSRCEVEKILKGSKDRGFFDDYMERLMTRAKACHGCQGGKTFLAVDVGGDIYFCSSLADRPEFKMGDVFSGLDLAVQDAFNESFHVDARSDCRRCWARNLCGGGCLYDARTATGDPMKPNPVSCEQIRYRYELAMEMCLEIQDSDETLLRDRFNLKWVGKADAS